MTAPVDAWLAAAVPGHSFADVGGLWGTVNEKATLGARSGASSSTMIDVTAEGGALWALFDERCRAAGVECRSVVGDVNDPGLLARSGTFDVVHCAGVLYHCPRPLWTLERLAAMTRKLLVLTSAVIAPSLPTDDGHEVRCDPGGALFVPALDGRQRQAAARWFEAVGASELLGITSPAPWRQEDTAPWWWLFTAEHLRALLEVSGFSVQATAPAWGGRAASFLAAKIGA